MILLLIVSYLIRINNGLITFYKKLIRMLIIQDHHNSITPMASKNGVNVNGRDNTTVRKK